MALGRHYIDPTTLDTASDPDDTTLLAAQGLRQRGYIKQCVLTITTAQASSLINIEDGVGGSVLLTNPGTSTGTFILCRFEDDEEGIRCSENTLLNATIQGATGVVASIQAVVDVRGG